VPIVETVNLAEVFPAQLTQYFDLSSNASNNPVFVSGANTYIFVVDGIGDFTWQIFIRQSVDFGTTWTDVTPGTPKYAGSAPPLGLTYYQIGTVVYIPQIYTRGDSTQWARVYRFDLNTLDWLADSSEVQVGFTSMGGNDDFVGFQGAVRGTEIVCISTNNADPPVSDQNVLLVYDSISNSWASGPTAIFGASVLDISSGGTDSVGRLHFFAGLWPSAARDTSGTFTAQHFIVNADNSLTVRDSIVVVTPFVVPTHDSGNAAWVSIGQPVFYLDGINQRMAVAIRTDSTTIQVFVSPESLMPVWTSVATINAGAGQVFETSSACFMFTASLAPLTIAGVTRLYVFWVSQTGDLWNNPGNSFLYHAYISNSILSAVTQDWTSSAQLMPGAFYPILFSDVLMGGFFPIFNGVNFLVDFTCLSEYWLTLALSVTLSADCNDPPNGSIGAPYSHFLTAADGSPPYTFMLTGGALPAGLSLNPVTGEISGTPTGPTGHYPFTVTVLETVD